MNLRFGLAKGGENRRERRKKIVWEFFETAPDGFIGFEEMNYFRADFLEKIMKGYGYNGPYNRNLPGVPGPERRPGNDLYKTVSIRTVNVYH